MVRHGTIRPSLVTSAPDVLHSLLLLVKEAEVYHSSIDSSVAFTCLHRSLFQRLIQNKSIELGMKYDRCCGCAVCRHMRTLI